MNRFTLIAVALLGAAGCGEQEARNSHEINDMALAFEQFTSKANKRLDSFERYASEQSEWLEGQQHGWNLRLDRLEKLTGWALDDEHPDYYPDFEDHQESIDSLYQMMANKDNQINDLNNAIVELEKRLAAVEAKGGE